MFNKKHYFLIFILFFAVFLRFWNLPNTMQFLGDQGRDSLIVSRIFKQKDLVFIGPVTSVGNMYLGPLYYYFMVPFLMLTYPNPLGPVYAVAFLGVLTIYLMYALGKELVGERAAMIAATLMTFSATVIAGTRFSWNPNPAPLVSLLMIYFVFKAFKKDVKYWILVVLCFSILIQLHYLTLLSGLSFGILWIWQLTSILKEKNTKILKKLFFSTAVGILVFLISLTPLILFDMKHNALNINAFKDILTKENSFEQKSPTVLGKVGEYILKTRGESRHILLEISIGKNKNFDTLLLLSIFVILFFSLKNIKKADPFFYGKIIVTVFLITGILGTSLYSHIIFDHYIAYLFPVSFFILGIVGDYLFRKRFLGKVAILFFMVLFINYNFKNIVSNLSSVSSTMNRVWENSKTIYDRVAEGEKYNIVLLTGTGDIEGQNYRYFLSTTDKPPVKLEDRGAIETLFIINDDKVLKKVVDSPIYEIVVFPNKVPSEVYEIEDGPEITVLRKN